MSPQDAAEKVLILPTVVHACCDPVYRSEHEVRALSPGCMQVFSVWGAWNDCAASPDLHQLLLVFVFSSNSRVQMLASLNWKCTYVLTMILF